MSTSGRDKSGGVLDLHAIPVLRAGVKLDRSGLRPDESTLVNLLDGRRNVGDLLRLSGMSGYVLMHHLRSLHERELVTLMRRPGGGRRTEEAFSRGATLTQLPQMPPEAMEGIVAAMKSGQTDANGMRPINLIVGSDGQADCLSEAPSADVVRQAHEAMGLAVGEIREVTTVV